MGRAYTRSLPLPVLTSHTKRLRMNEASTIQELRESNEDLSKRVEQLGRFL